MCAVRTRTCRAKNTLIKSACCIKLAFQIISWGRCTIKQPSRLLVWYFILFRSIFVLNNSRTAEQIARKKEIKISKAWMQRNVRLCVSVNSTTQHDCIEHCYLQLQDDPRRVINLSQSPWRCRKIPPPAMSVYIYIYTHRVFQKIWTSSTLATEVTGPDTLWFFSYGDTLKTMPTNHITARSHSSCSANHWWEQVS